MISLRTLILFITCIRITPKKIDVHKLLKERHNRPIWFTEINRRDGSKGGKKQEQAEHVSGPVVKLAGTVGIQAIFLHEILDEP